MNFLKSRWDLDQPGWQTWATSRNIIEDGVRGQQGDSRLASLPADLVEQIRNTAVTADYGRLMELIETVKNKNLSLVLSVLVKRYNCQKLLDLLDSS